MSFRIAFYKGTRPGIAGIYNRGVRLWTRGPYSHVELIFSDGIAASASFADGGVRFKSIEFDPTHWDIIDLPAEWEASARAYFEAHEGEKYDLLGNLHFVIGAVADSRDRKFCSEAVAGALDLGDPWRYEPNALFSAVTRLVREHHRGQVRYEKAFSFGFATK